MVLLVLVLGRAMPAPQLRSAGHVADGRVVTLLWESDGTGVDEVRDLLGRVRAQTARLERSLGGLRGREGVNE